MRPTYGNTGLDKVRAEWYIRSMKLILPPAPETPAQMPYIWKLPESPEISQGAYRLDQNNKATIRPVRK